MIEPTRHLDYYDLKRVEERMKACKKPEGKKTMSAWWYEEDIPMLLAEIERLREVRKAA